MEVKNRRKKVRRRNRSKSRRSRGKCYSYIRGFLSDS